jgi:dihydrofolate reductase
MRRVVLQEFVSANGLAAGPNDSVDFIPSSTQGDAAFGREQLALMDTIDTLLLGRVTYAMFAGFWPNVTEGPEKEFADKFNGLQKVVFSKTLKRAPWGKWKDGRIVSGSAVEEVAKLKQQPGKNMLISGSITIAQALIAEGMVDEYRLVLCPVVLGGGRPLFRDNAGSITMKLLNERKLDRGAVSLIYSP